jgi:tagatose-6-phosphate ketose/aldose isomerase
MAELDRKQLGARKVVVGEGIAVLDVVVGQLLAYYRCLAEGLDPDMPSTGAISRVVNEFAIHQNRKS